METLQKRHQLADMKMDKKQTDFRTLRRLDKELMKQVLGRKGQLLRWASEDVRQVG